MCLLHSVSICRVQRISRHSKVVFFWLYVCFRSSPRRPDFLLFRKAVKECWSLDFDVDSSFPNLVANAHFLYYSFSRDIRSFDRHIVRSFVKTTLCIYFTAYRLIGFNGFRGIRRLFAFGYTFVFDPLPSDFLFRKAKLKQR